MSSLQLFSDFDPNIGGKINKYGLKDAFGSPLFELRFEFYNYNNFEMHK